MRLPDHLTLFRRCWRPAAAVLIAGGLALPTAATAGTIGIDAGRRLIVGTEAGDGGQAIQAFLEGTDLRVSAAGFDLVTPGCSNAGDTFLCALSAFDELVVLGGAGDDVVDLGAIPAGVAFAITVLGGAGDDVLVGSGSIDNLFDGAGDDILIGNGGRDCFSEGPGDDVLIGGGCLLDGPDPLITPLARDPAAAVPEPGAGLLAGMGLMALAATRRRRR